MSACRNALLLSFFALGSAATASIDAARQALRLGDLPTAVALAERAVTQNPADIGSWCLLAETKLAHGGRAESSEAVSELRRLSMLGSEPVDVRLTGYESRLRHLVELFTTEEGQKQYLVGRALAAHGDCRTALGAFVEATRREGSHPLVLAEKARCELKLEQVATAAGTLADLDRVYWFDVPSAQLFAETQLFLSKPEDARRVLLRFTEARLSDSARLALAVADVDAGKNVSAFPRFLALLAAHRREGTEAPSLALWGAGVLLARTQGRLREGSVYLRQFLSRPAPVSGTWDPFRWSDRVASARTVLGSYDREDEPDRRLVPR